MKEKIIFVFLCLMIVAMIPACGNSGDAAKITSNRPAGVNDVLQAGIAEAEADKAEADKAEDESLETEVMSETDSPAKEDGVVDGVVEPESERKSGLNDNAPVPENTGEIDNTLSGSDGIDVDLTVLSSTMVYSEVYNMMVEPEAYIGKTVKMEGVFSSFYDETLDVYYYACIIQDATACCAQGIEFELTDEYSYPDDYPEEGDNVCVAGVFDTYQEGEYTYCTLRNAKLVKDGEV